MKKIATILGVLCVLCCMQATLPTAWAEEGKWQARSRLIFIEPNDDADGALGMLKTEVDSDFTVEVDGTYFVTPRFGIEGILATAAQEVTIDDGSGRVSLGSVYHAPATFLAQYHFRPEEKTRPYAGAGINYTIFYSESGALADLDLDSASFGLAGQLGVDFMLGEKLLFNIDVKYIEIDLDVDDPSSGTALGAVDVHPLVVGAGLGVRF
jgi:outer membrane protein